jgi:serine/threonine protein kinase
MAAKILIDAANYCHDLGILHRDIKLENILFKTSDHDLKFMKIADFGLAKILNKD